MRGICCCLLLLAACGEPPAIPDGKTGAEPWPVDGFLRLVPENASIIARLPRTATDETARTAALTMFGWAGDDALLANLDGRDPERADGCVVTAAGTWLHFLPAADKGRMNAALRERADRLAVREEADWLVIGTGGAPAPGEAEPLRPGDAAVRVEHHALLNELAQPGDRLDIGVSLFGGGIDASGHLTPGKGSPTADAIARAGGPLEGHLDLLPAALSVRVESTIPTTAYATWLARRIALHTSLAEGELRDNIERFLREAATGIDAASGIAFGIDLTTPKAPGFVAVGRIAAGPASPILAKLRRGRRESFGGLVLDVREVKQKGLLGWYAWVPQAVASDAGLPRTALPLLGALVSEDDGVPVAYAEAEGYAILAAGARADLLASAVHRCVTGGATQSAGARQLAILRDRRDDGDCILAVVVAGNRFEGLAPSDAGALRSLLGATEKAVAPAHLVVAGFRAEAGLDLEARVIYR